MAPEQLANENHDPKLADIYSLGVILYVMYTCCFPYSAACPSDEVYETIMRRNYSDFWEYQTLIHKDSGMKFSDEMKYLLSQLLCHKPEHRPDFESI